MESLDGPVRLLIDELRNVASADRSLQDAVARVHDTYAIPIEILDAAAVRIDEIRRAMVDVNVNDVVGGARHEPWFFRSTNPNSDLYWRAFSDQLATRLPPSVVSSVDTISARILNQCPPPRTTEIRTRGLVLGYVQSGKTTNFTGVIASAADAGYRLFVVLSGLHSNLRMQTQVRLDKDLVAPLSDRWVRLTDEQNDFGTPRNAQSLLSSNFDGRLLAVVKKNKRRLENLNDWLDGLSDIEIGNVPIMIIDDEADQASLNFSLDATQRTAINSQILKLLNRPKAAYIGYTATPFANILGPPTDDTQDLYPRDFIIPLPRPADYFGPERVFGRRPLTPDDDPVDGCDMVRLVPTEEADQLRVPGRRAERQLYDPPMVPSMDRAIRYFLMATTDRRLREGDGGATHSSMLIHVTHYVDGHEKIRDLVDTHLLHMSHRLRSDEAFVAELEEQWTRERERIGSSVGCAVPTAGSSFAAIIQRLSETLNETRTIVDNGSSEDRLSYDEGRVVTAIVIGGNTLSRGLTLEGLVSSYFLRAGRNYDTLLQMGRWFGYRIGYEDLPRVWTTRELEDNFRFFALLEEEMRQYISELAHDPAITPSNYPVRIRTHPSMQITGAMRMQNARVIRASFSGYSGEAILYPTEPAVLDSNLAAASQLLNAGSDARTISAGKLLLSGVEGRAVREFFDTYQLHHRNQILRNRQIVEYLDTEMLEGDLQTWNVVVIGRDQPDERLGAIRIGDYEFNALSRSQRPAFPPDPSVVDIGVLTSPSDRRIDIDTDFRPHGHPGLILLYPISKDSEPSPGALDRMPLDTTRDVVGLAVAFPGSPRASDVEWAIPDLQTQFEFEEVESEDVESQDHEGDKND